MLQNRSRIADHIYQGIKDLLPSKINIIDKVVTKFHIAVEKKENKAYFSDRIENIPKHYKLKDGCNLTLWCCNEEDFEIVTVKDLHMKIIKCPLPAKTYGAQNNLPENEFTIESDDSDVHQFLGEYQPGMDMEESMDSEDEHLATSIITLTKSHIVSNNLVRKFNISL